MENQSLSLLYLEAEKKIKSIKGLYTHLFSTLLILPFIVFVNLKVSPQYHWFWFAIGAWFVGLFIHFISVYVCKKLDSKNWNKRN